MPIKVTGADGRLLHDNLSDKDALDLARRVHEVTGEEVTLTPLVFDGEEYVEDPGQARVFGAVSEEPAEEPEAAPVKKNARKRATRGE